MTFYDVRLLEWVYEGGQKYRLKLSQFDGGGHLSILDHNRPSRLYKHRGAEALLRDDRKAMEVDFRLCETDLIGEGWLKKSGTFTANSWGNGIFVRPTTVPSLDTKPFGERLRILDRIMENGKSDEERRTAGEFRFALEQYIATIEQQSSVDQQPKNSLAEQLERISDLHRQGDLTDTDFEQAKKKLLAQ